MILKITLVSLLMLSSLIASESFNKVMAKNRASKNIGNSNYKVIDGNKEYEEAKKKGSIGLNIENKTKGVGTVYNHVEIKNVNMEKKIKKREYGLSKIKAKPIKKNLLGVKSNKTFTGSINNTVKIKNSNLE